MKLINQRSRIAVIGAGVAGIAAAHRLSQKHDVTLFEASDELGGHAHSETLKNENGESYSVDTGFLIFNEKTYPNFMKMIAELGVSDKATRAEMSSCFSDPENNFFYTLGAGLGPFLARPQTLVKKELYHVLRDFLHFRKKAAADLNNGVNLSGITAGEYLSSYSSAFVNNFVWPLTSAIWSLAENEMPDYPIASLLIYFDNHQLIRGKTEKKWRTFLGSSRVYIEAFEKSYTGKIRLNSPVSSVSRTPEGIQVNKEIFDYAVLATHADQSLKMIAEPNTDEKSLLGAWKYKNNPVALHHDISVLHHDSRMWGSWNMRRQGSSHHISYFLNRLQSLPTKKPVVLSLGKLQIDENQIIKRFNYLHPVFDLQSVATQKHLPRLNGQDRLFFCGSYFGHGFHEDAVQSAAELAKCFGC
ncbi:MAG: NAD(P)/FAD-dependent oxidoreductase [Pseudobdellovibrio sp.]